MNFATLRDPLIYYKEYLKIKGHTQEGIRTYSDRVTYFLRKAAKNIRDITTKDIENFIKQDLKRGIKIKTIKSNFWALNSFFSWLEKKEKAILINPLKNIELPRDEKRIIQDVITEKDMERLIEATETRRDRAILEVLYSSGIRKGELYKLDLNDVDLKSGYLFVRQGKGNKDRVVPLGKVAIKALKIYLEERKRKSGHSNALFLSNYPFYAERMNFRITGEIIKRYADKIGLKVSPHTIRRSFATHMIRAGCDIMHLKEMMGHSKLDTLKVYIKLSCIDIKGEHKKTHPRGR